MSLLEFQPGDIVIKRGETASFMGLVLKGQFEVGNETKRHKDLNLCCSGCLTHVVAHMRLSSHELTDRSHSMALLWFFNKGLWLVK